MYSVYVFIFFFVKPEYISDCTDKAWGHGTYTVVSLSLSLSLRGYSRGDTALERTQVLGSNYTVNVCDAPSHQRTPL